MSEIDWTQSKDGLDGKPNLAGVTDKIKWSEETSMDCVNVGSRANPLLVCIVKDSSSGHWSVKGFNPNSEAVSNDIKLLAVPEKAIWKLFEPSSKKLPNGAISGGKEHQGANGEIYVGRVFNTDQLGTIFISDLKYWFAPQNGESKQVNVKCRCYV